MDEDKQFTVAVVATMSAGKSTLLNAMIGEELLPAKNEACTATVFQIEDHDDITDFIARYSSEKKHGEWLPIKKEMLEEWNKQGHKLIEIHGDLPNIKNTRSRHKVVFFDTPGPNNSMEDSHAKITKKIIKESAFCSLVCVLNASVLGVKDEWRLLTLIKKELERNIDYIQPLFVINKIDLLDVERGENPLDIVKGARDYLIELGFVSPIVIPTSSNLSLAIRNTMQTATRMTAKEVRGDYRGAEKLKSFFSRRYKSTETPRRQNALKNRIKIMFELEQEYRKALNNSDLLKRAFANLKQTHTPTPRRKIKIGGEYFTYADLYKADGLSGVPYLEKVIENKLNQYAKQNNRHRSK